jgi:hypothetical protein
VITKVVVLWVVTPCGYRRFGGTSTINMNVAISSETLVGFYETTRRHDSEHYNLNNGDTTIYIQVEQILCSDERNLEVVFDKFDVYRTNI